MNSEEIIIDNKFTKPQVLDIKTLPLDGIQEVKYMEQPKYHLHSDTVLEIDHLVERNFGKRFYQSKYNNDTILFIYPYDDDTIFWPHHYYGGGWGNKLMCYFANPEEVYGHSAGNDSFTDFCNQLITYEQFSRELPEFSNWIIDTVSDYNYVQVTKLDDIFKVFLYTDNYCYILTASNKNDYLGLYVQSRKYEAGEMGLRGKNLIDGNFTMQTYGLIIKYIVKNELVEISEIMNVNE